MAEPDLELRGVVVVGGGEVNLTCPASFSIPSVVSSFYTQNMGGGGGRKVAGLLGPSPRSATDSLHDSCGMLQCALVYSRLHKGVVGIVYMYILYFHGLQHIIHYKFAWNS